MTDDERFTDISGLNVPSRVPFLDGESAEAKSPEAAARLSPVAGPETRPAWAPPASGADDEAGVTVSPQVSESGHETGPAGGGRAKSLANLGRGGNAHVQASRAAKATRQEREAAGRMSAYKARLSLMDTPEGRAAVLKEIGADEDVPANYRVQAINSLRVETEVDGLGFDCVVCGRVYPDTRTWVAADAAVQAIVPRPVPPGVQAWLEAKGDEMAKGENGWDKYPKPKKPNGDGGAHE